MPRSSDLTRPVRPLRIAAGGAVAGGVALLVVALLVAIWHAAADEPPTAGSRIDLGHLLAMTGIQAGLSTLLSLAAGIALAWALNRLRFPGRDLVVGLFASAIVTPGIIVAFGLLAVWGRAGWVAQATGVQVPLFGLGGILAAHVILDGAFAARVLLTRLDAIPEARLKTGQSLALGARQRFAVIDWPMLAPALPGLGAVIFLLAFTSFPVVLLLGGGPANQTLEVAIYSAVRLDFDLKGAVVLALVQVGFCGALILLASAFAPPSTGIGLSPPPRWRDRGAARALQGAVLAAGIAGFALPLLAVLLGGVGPGLGEVLMRPSVWTSLLTSLVVASLAAVLALGLAIILCAGRAASVGPLARIGLAAPAYAYLAVPAVVLALGFFLLVRGFGVMPQAAAPAIVVLANALLSLPFAVATLGPAFDAVVASRGKLIRSLGLTGLSQFRDVEWPLVARDAGLVLALSFCFSLGDLGVIALFGSEDFATLPLTMYRALGAYRSNDAGAIAALLLVLTVAVFVLVPKLFEGLGDARH